MDSPTRVGNILDLILTNDEDLVSSVRVEESGSFLYFSWVIGEINVTLARRDDSIPESLIYSTTIPNFNWRNGSVEQWDKYQEVQANCEWSQETKYMSITEKVNFLNRLMETAVSSAFEDLLKRKVERKRRIPKEIRSLFKKKSDLSRKIHRTKCRIKLVS